MQDYGNHTGCAHKKDTDYKKEAGKSFTEIQREQWKDIDLELSKFLIKPRNVNWKENAVFFYKLWIRLYDASKDIYTFKYLDIIGSELLKDFKTDESVLMLIAKETPKTPSGDTVRNARHAEILLSEHPRKRDAMELPFEFPRPQEIAATD